MTQFPQKRKPKANERFVKTNIRGMVKDRLTGAVIANSKDEEASFKARRKAMIDKKTEMQNLKDEVANLKALVKKLLQKT